MNEYKVRDLLTIKNGKDHKHLGDGKYPVYGSGGIMRYVDSYLYDKPSILLPRKGTLDNIQYCDTPFWCVDTTYYSEVNTSLANPYYLYRYLSILNLKGLDSGTALPSMTFDSYYQIKVSLPNIEMQNRIGNALYQIDQKIALNTRMNAELEAMAKQLYDYWFVQFDFPDENGNPYKSSGGKMVYNSTLKREIPAGWEVTSIGDLITTERGISYSTPNISSGNGVPMLNLATFMPGGGDYKASGLKHYLGDYPPSKVLKPYDLIMCNTQQTAIKFETDIIGRAMLVPDIFEGDIVFSHHVNIIKTENDDLKYYLLYLFNSDYYHKYISGYTNGTNILGLSLNGVSEYNLEIPPEAILKQFASLILDVAKKKSLIFKESSNLTHLRDSLLPMLMNGQVTVEFYG